MPIYQHPHPVQGGRDGGGGNVGPIASSGSYRNLQWSHLMSADSGGYLTSHLMSLGHDSAQFAPPTSGTGAHPFEAALIHHETSKRSAHSNGLWSTSATAASGIPGTVGPQRHQAMAGQSYIQFGNCPPMGRFPSPVSNSSASSYASSHRSSIDSGIDGLTRGDRSAVLLAAAAATVTPEGMSQVQSWLKSLRLHKYGPIFAMLSYDEMMALSDEYLELKGVTRGARNKILVNIRKLHSRKQTLLDLDGDLDRDSSPANLKTVLADLKGIIVTPMKPSDELPARFLQVMCKVFTKTVQRTEVDREVGATFRWLADRVVAGEAFNREHKRLVKTWRSQLGRVISASRVAVGMGGLVQTHLHNQGSLGHLGSHTSACRSLSFSSGGSQYSSSPTPPHTPNALAGGKPKSQVSYEAIRRPVLSQIPMNMNHHSHDVRSSSSSAALLSRPALSAQLLTATSLSSSLSSSRRQSTAITPIAHSLHRSPNWSNGCLNSNSNTLFGLNNSNNAIVPGSGHAHPLSLLADPLIGPSLTLIDNLENCSEAFSSVVMSVVEQALEM